MVAAELPLILVLPFNDFKKYVLFEFIDTKNTCTNNKQQWTLPVFNVQENINSS